MNIGFPRSPWIRFGLMLVAGAAVAVAILWRGPSWTAVSDAFTAVSWRWVVAAIGINLLSVIARSMAWRIVINQALPPPTPGYRAVFAAFSVGLLANAVLPGRIGELARVAVLNRRLEDPPPGAWATLVGTVFAHRVFDLVAVVALIVFVLLTAKIPHWAVASLVVIVVVGIALLAFAIALAKRPSGTRHEAAAAGAVRRLVTMARQGLGVMKTPVAAFEAILFQLLGWVCQLFAVWVAMRAFDIHEGLPAAGLVLVLMTVATVFPLWPGNVGLVQAAVALPLVQDRYSWERIAGRLHGIYEEALAA